MADDLARVAAVLRDVFGFESFRLGQAEAAASVMAKKNVFVRMKTSGGKSLCCVLPALLFPGVTLVVSPLISLMEDQVSQTCCTNKNYTAVNKGFELFY